MFGTLITLLVAVLTAFLSFNDKMSIDSSISAVLAIVPILLLVSLAFVWIIASLGLQKAEQNLTSGVMQLVKKDKHTKFYSAGILTTAFLALFILLNPQSIEKYTSIPWIAPWLVLIGMAFDFLYLTIKRIYEYINPLSVVALFTQAAKKSVKEDREVDMCNWVESLSEIAVKSLHRSSNSLCVNSISEMREVLRMFLDSSKSVAHETQDQQSLSEGITDKVSYTLFYILDRLSLIYHKALADQIEPVCSAVITTLGKITVDAANCDLSLVSHPVRFIGEFCRKAEDRGMKEIPIKGSCTLVEASKVIINQVDLTYQDLIFPFSSIINQLNETAKESFRKDKNLNIKGLMQPLLDLKNLFQSEKLAKHRDTPSLKIALDNVLSEWETLDTVLRTMPPIPIPNES